MMLSESSSKKITSVIGGIVFLISMIPVIWLIPFDYAAAEDMGFGSNVHRVLMDGGSFLQVMQAAWSRLISIYNTHEGSWVSDFLVQFEPSVWGEKVYCITPIVAIVLILVAQWMIFRILIKDFLGMDDGGLYAFLFPYMLFFFQYMRSPKYGLYFYTGMIRYTMPVMVTLIIFTVLVKVLKKDFKARWMFSLIPLTVIVGGCGYPPAVLLLVLFILLAVRFWFSPYRSRVLWLLVPFFPFLISLYVSVIAPGNQNRSGGNLHMGLAEVLTTVMRSLFEGIVGSCAESSFYLYIRPLFLLVLGVVLLAFMAYQPGAGSLKPKHPLIAVVFHILIISCVHAPEVLVHLEGGDVNEGFSNGVYNTYYFVFMISTASLCIYLGAWLKLLVLEKHCESHILDRKWFRKHILIPISVFTILFCTLFWRHLIGTTVDYQCIMFICDGHLADYDFQMRERIAILTDESIQDAVVPQMNDEQDPLMHFALSETDPGAWANACTRRFYGKKSVIAMPRDQFYVQYGQILAE